MSHLDVYTSIYTSESTRHQLQQACKNGDDKQVRAILIATSAAPEIGMKFACYHGHLNVVKVLLEFNAKSHSNGILEACYGGHMHIIEYIIEYTNQRHTPFRLWNIGLLCAARGGHLNVINFMLSNGATDITSALMEASLYGRLEAVKLFLQLGARNVNDLSETITAQLLDQAYEIDNHWTEVLVKSRNKKRERTTQVLNDRDMEIHDYDPNISNIISDYVGHI